jgi:hypothetical protein
MRATCALQVYSEAEMKLITAILTHAWLALGLKHNGAGMPTKLPAACLLISLYIALNLANKNINGGIDVQTLFGLSFIAPFYLFGLRNKLIGLIILISVVSNALSLTLTTLTGAPEDKLFMLIIVEYIMIFAGVINVIKSEIKAI